jgi:hypothetical protein
MSNAEWWDSVPPPVVFGHTVPAPWWEAAKAGAARNCTDPFRIIAVAAIESDVRRHGWYDGRIGRSRYIAPMGFNRACARSAGGSVPDAVMHDPCLQIQWAARLLRGDLWRRLGRYNECPDRDHYRRDVVSLARSLERRARVDLEGVGYGN